MYLINMGMDPMRVRSVSFIALLRLQNQAGPANAFTGKHFCVVTRYPSITSYHVKTNLIFVALTKCAKIFAKPSQPSSCNQTLKMSHYHVYFQFVSTGPENPLGGNGQLRTLHKKNPEQSDWCKKH